MPPKPSGWIPFGRSRSGAQVRVILVRTLLHKSPIEESVVKIAISYESRTT